MDLVDLLKGLVGGARTPPSTEPVRVELRTLLTELSCQETCLLTSFCRGNADAINRVPLVTERLEAFRGRLASEPDLQRDLEELVNELKVLTERARMGTRDSLAPYLTGTRQCCRRILFAIDHPTLP